MSGHPTAVLLLPLGVLLTPSYVAEHIAVCLKLSWLVAKLL